MSFSVGYAVIFFVTFGIVAIAAALGWMFVDRKGDDGEEPDILRGRRLSTLQLLSQTLERGRLGDKPGFFQKHGIARHAGRHSCR